MEPQPEEEAPKEEEGPTEVTMEDDDLSFTQTKKKRRKKPVDIDEIPKDEADGAGDDCKLAIGLDNQNFQRKTVNIFLPIIFSI